MRALRRISPIQRTAAASFLALVLLGSLPLRADEIDTLNTAVMRLETESSLLDTLLSTAAAERKSDDELAERALVDGQVSHELKEYETAAIRLLDVVEKYPRSPAYRDALFFLADSLFHRRDYFSSRSYFEKLVELGNTSVHYEEALQRLVELALHTGDYDRVDGYLARLEGLPPERQRSSIPYVKGKYYYFRKKYDDADKAFKAIQLGQQYWFQGQYFLGAGLVARHAFEDAVLAFTALVAAKSKNNDEKQVVALGHLALGRLYYETGQYTRAIGEYKSIPLKSDLAPDALYEQAWTSVKTQDFKDAFHALDTLLTLRPDDPMAPEIKLLIGNLHIRETDYDQARASFTRTREEFEPIHKQMAAARTLDAAAYFHALTQKNLSKFDTAIGLPSLAVRWIEQTPDLARAVVLGGDVSELKKSLDEAQQTLQRIEKALAGDGRINIFPDLATARAAAVRLAGRVNDTVKQLVKNEAALEEPLATAEERAALGRLVEVRTRLDRELANLPKASQSPAERNAGLRRRLEELDQEATLVFAQIQNYAAVRVGIELFYSNLLKERAIAPTAPQRETALRELSEAKQEEDRLRQRYEQLRQDIADTTIGLSSNYDVDTAHEADLRRQLGDVLTQEHALGGMLRARLTGAPRQKADRIAAILDRAAAVERQLTEFTERIDRTVEDKLKKFWAALAEEQAHVAAYQRVLTTYADQSGAIGTGVTEETVRQVAERIYNVVVRADVGILDVAWALKDAQTQENNRLLREQKRELKLLDDEFAPVLKE